MENYFPICSNTIILSFLNVTASPGLKCLLRLFWPPFFGSDSHGIHAELWSHEFTCLFGPQEPAAPAERRERLFAAILIAAITMEADLRLFPPETASKEFRLSLRFMLFPAEKTMPLPNCIPDK
ncbi:MAG: hypothetical protein ACLT8C_07285 [Akkermansia muciniphila]